MKRNNKWRFIVALAVTIAAVLLTRAECSAGRRPVECVEAVLMAVVAASGSTGDAAGIDGGN